jgi:hypothetical protein
MSRFNDGEGDEDYPNQWALWDKRAQLALEGKRGKAALRELREALEALPEKRLISGALCTIGLQSKLETLPVQLENPNLQTNTGEPVLYLNPARQDLEEFVLEHGKEPEGVCAMGAMAWYRKVKAGMDPAEAFASLPVLPDTAYDAASATARLGRDELGLAYVLAYTIAEQNDSEYSFGELTPEERYTAFLEWIDQELRKPPLRRPARKPKRERRRIVAGAALTAMRRPPVDAPRLGL